MSVIRIHCAGSGGVFLVFEADRVGHGERLAGAYRDVVVVAVAGGGEFVVGVDRSGRGRFETTSSIEVVSRLTICLGYFSRQFPAAMSTYLGAFRECKAQSWKTSGLHKITVDIFKSRPAVVVWPHGTMSPTGLSLAKKT